MPVCLSTLERGDAPMPWNTHRSWGILATLALFLPLPAPGQDPPPRKPPSVNDLAKEAPQFSQNLALPTDPKFARLVEVIGPYIAKQAWPEVTQSLQAFLDRPEDFFVPRKVKGADGKDAVQWVS